MSINPEYDGSQKKTFLELVAQRISYLEVMSSRLPMDIEQKQMELKAVQDELGRLYQIIPEGGKFIVAPDYETFKEAPRPYSYGGNRNA